MSAPESPAAGREESSEFPGYRALQLGEIIQKGDRCRDTSVAHGLLTRDSTFVGYPIDSEDVNSYFRPLPEGPDPENHDENCFLAMGGGGMCNCSLSKDPEKGRDLDGSAKGLTDASRQIREAIADQMRTSAYENEYGKAAAWNKCSEGVRIHWRGEADKILSLLSQAKPAGAIAKAEPSPSSVVEAMKKAPYGHSLVTNLNRIAGLAAGIRIGIETTKGAHVSWEGVAEVMRAIEKAADKLARAALADASREGV